MQHKKWLIFGGSGFLGNQLTKDILDKYNPHSIRIFSRNEAKQAEMHRRFKDTRIRFIIGDIANANSVDKALRDIDLCINAAAMKRIDTCESNPIEAVRVNTLGTINVIESALNHNIECLLYVSTDKAKSPETTYGFSKAMSENLMRNAYHEKDNRRTKFKTVRYGNVWGSTGSVATIWQEQYKKDKTIYVTNKEMTRFFMSVQEASKLVLDTIENGEENTEHSLPMKAVNMYELAKYLYPDAKIEIRPGSYIEKIHEDLYEGYNSKTHCVPVKEHSIWRLGK